MKDYLHLFGGMIVGIILLAGYIFCWGYIQQCHGEDTPIVAETLFEDGTTNKWTQADLQAALGLLNRKYHRDVKTEKGRVAWHGKKVGYHENTNTLTVVTTYADGTKFTDPVTVKKPASLESRMAAAKAMKSKRRAETMPPGLAATAAKREESAATTNEVTVTVGQ